MRRLGMILLLVTILSDKAWGQQDRSFDGLFDRLMKNFETDMERQMKWFENFFQKGSLDGDGKNVSPV